tara:strand:- start:11547 stop:12464 length:918 start_codon:yes stop_codon:yes gene_type:complete
MRVLVTGAKGFIGREVVVALARLGHDVHAISRSGFAGGRRDFSGHTADLHDPVKTAEVIAAVKPEAVINLAWYVEHGKFWTADENITWLSTSLQLARLSVGAGVRRFIGIGTCYEYDWPDDKSCTEGVTPTANHTLYDTTKDSCRRTLSSFFSQNDTDFVWARVFSPYGPSEPSGRLVASVARALINGERARCSSGSAVRDFVEVRDVGEAIASIAESDVTGVINVGSGQGVSVSQIAVKLGELAGRPDLVELGALPDRAGEPPYIVADTTKLFATTGFRPRIGLDSGLRYVLDYWRRRSSESPR